MRDFTTRSTRCARNTERLPRYRLEVVLRACDDLVKHGQLADIPPEWAAIEEVTARLSAQAAALHYIAPEGCAA